VTLLDEMVAELDTIGVDAEASWIYAGARVLGSLRESWRLTLDEAKEFGELYGVCVRCGRTLTLEQSIEEAMGRICASKSDYWA
jgi:hypothetical protein